MAGLGSMGLRQALANPQHSPALRRRLSPAQARLVACLADLVIPRTDTPGAIDAGVPEFMHTVLERWCTDTEFSVFAEGLSWLERAAGERYGGAFARCAEAEQTVLLHEAEVQARDWHRAHPEKVSADSLIGKTPIDEHIPFFTRLKELVTVGYYTSELAAQAVLVYLPIPMRYTGEASLADSAGKPYVW